MNQRYDRRLFLSRSARVMGGLTIVSSLPVLWGCGSDDDDSGSDTTAASNAGTSAGTSAGSSPATSGGGEAGTVGTQFNWVPDVEWAAWYLGDANGHFSERNVTSELGHGGPNTPAVVQVLAAGDGNVGLSASELDITQANEEGSDFVIIGSMYQRNPLGLTWLAGTTINTRRGPGRQAHRRPPGRPGAVRGRAQDQRSAPRLRVHPDELRPAAARRRRDGRHHLLRHEPAHPAPPRGSRGRGQAVLRLRPAVLRRHPLRVEGMDRREPRPARALPRRPARRRRGQPHRPEGRDPDPGREVRVRHGDQRGVRHGGQPRVHRAHGQRVHRRQRAAVGRPRQDGERGAPRPRGRGCDRPADGRRAPRCLDPEGRARPRVRDLFVDRPPRPSRDRDRRVRAQRRPQGVRARSQAARGHRARGSHRGDGHADGAARTLRMRQVDGPADARRAGGAHVRQRPHPWPRAVGVA